MIASMTGFARRELAGSFGTLTCELRSVNHRYLEPGFRLPEELRPLESDLRQLLTKNLKRGKVDCTMHLRGGSGRRARAAPRRGGAGTRGGRGPGSAGGVAQSDRRCRRGAALAGRGRDRGAPDSEALLGAGRTLFQQTLDDLGAMRLREGKRLGELLEQRCAGLATLVVAGARAAAGDPGTHADAAERTRCGTARRRRSRSRRAGRW